MSQHARPFPVVVDTSHSPFARLKPVPLTAVKLTDEFWAPRLRTNRTVTLPGQHRLLEETGRLDNLRRAAGRKGGEFQGYMYNDSDVYKWIEAAAWALATADDPGLTGLVEGVIDDVAAAQQPDGYLNSYFMFEREAERWTNLADMHELYCAGHLMQAAVAHHRATGRTRLLDVARRLADLIVGRYGPGCVREGVPGHPEIEMALVELGRDTGEQAYLRQAQRFIDNRGHGLIKGREYHLDHVPFRNMEQLGGHAVRALYLSAGAADVVAETGEPVLRRALDRLWGRMMAGQLYVTGALGSRYDGESLGKDHELPNERAYAETCAAIAGMMWNWRMLALDGDARYADALETALYNGVLSGVSLDGLSYFYENPLASDGSHRRQPWFPCACCPPNAARLLAELPGYFYCTSREGLWVHLYAEGQAALRLPGGESDAPVTLAQRTRYPWDGEVTLEVEGRGEWSLFLRIPAWCEEGATLEVNGRAAGVALVPGTYAEVARSWAPGDVVRLSLPMAVRAVESHPYLFENAGRVALTRGPLVYCVEGADHAGIDVRDLVLLAPAQFKAVTYPDLPGGGLVLRGAAAVVPPGDGWENRLYRTVGRLPRPQPLKPAEIVAIPYYAWANRQPGPMQVWLRRVS